MAQGEDSTGGRRCEIDVRDERDASDYRCDCHGWVVHSNWRRENDHARAIGELQDRHRAAGFPVPVLAPRPPIVYDSDRFELWDHID